MAPPIRFTLDEVYEASDAWRFNCGPGALCAVTGRTPAEIRADLLDFEEYGYTNPTLMLGILNHLRIPHRLRLCSDVPVPVPNAMFPKFGLVRIQWGGPWTDRGVPMAARYRKTHWIATELTPESRMIFDINCMELGGWVNYPKWWGETVPTLLRELVPRNNGKWWPTHSIEFSLK